MSIQSALEELQKLSNRNLRIYFLNNALPSNLKTFMGTYGSNIETLRVFEFNIGALLSLMALTPNLNKLKIDSAMASDTGSNRNFKIDLLQLKTLKIFDATKLMKYIQCPQLEKLSISEDRPNVDLGSLVISGNVKELSLVGPFPNFKLSASSLRLTKFELVENDPSIPQNELREFLLTQKEFLKVLKVLQRGRVGLFEFVASKLKVEDFCTYVELSDSTEELKVNKSIKKLRLCGSGASAQYYRNIFQNLQAIEALEIITLEFSISTFAILPNLKSLIFGCNAHFEIDDLNVLEKVRFEQVECLQTRPNLQILQLFPNVKKLKIISEPISASTLKTILQLQKHLEEITAKSIAFDDETVELLLQSKIRKIATSLEHSEEQPLPNELKQSKIIFSKYFY